MWINGQEYICVDVLAIYFSIIPWVSVKVSQLCLTLCDPWDPFSRQEHWSELPCHSPGDLPNPGIEPRSPALRVDSLPAKLPGKPQCVFFLSKRTIKII